MVDGYLFNQLGPQHSYASTVGGDEAHAYYNRAISLGCTKAYLDKATELSYRYPTNTDRAIMVLLEAINSSTKVDGEVSKPVREQVAHDEEPDDKNENGIDCLLDHLLRLLTDENYNAPKDVLGSFPNQWIMAFYYANVLIQHDSPLGYEWLGHIYYMGYIDADGKSIPGDVKKQVEIYEHADRIGLASSSIYQALIHVYRYVVTIMDKILNFPMLL